MTQPRKERDVLIAGAGPVGLAAALVLDGLGYDVVLVSPARPADQRTSALLAGSVPLLRDIGVWPAIEAAAAPLRSLRIVDGTRRLIRAPEVIFHSAEIGLDAFGYNIPNRLLVAVLDAAVAERRIERRDASVEAAVGEAGEIAATLSGAETVRARLLVAADGRRSRLREAAGIAVSEWRYDQAALVVNLTHTLPHDDTSTEFHTEAGPFTLVPLGPGRSRLVWVDRPEEFERRQALPADRLAAEIEDRSAAILGAIALDGTPQVFPLAGMSARAMAGDRIALVGEAAHLFPPIGAQGLNLGFRDVAALGSALAARPEDPGSADHLAAFSRLRRTDVFARSLAVDTLNRTLLSGFLPVQAMRGLGLFLLDRVPALRQAVMRQGVAGL